MTLVFIFETLKQKIKIITNSVKLLSSKVPVKIWFILLALVIIIGYVLYFVVPKNVVFAYAENDPCVGSMTLLPGLNKQSGATSFKLQAEGGVKIGSFYLFSNKICFQPVVAPANGNIDTGYSPFGGPIFRKDYVVNVGPRPKVNAMLDQPVALAKPLEFTLDKPDNIFTYQLAIDKKTNTCQSKSDKISCDIKPLSLKQGENYAYKLTRTFNDKDASEAIAGNLSLLDPVSVTKASLQAGEVVYSKPKTFTFETDKKLTSAHASLEKIVGDKAVKIDSTTKVTGTTIEISIANELDREAKYRTTTDQAEGEDGSLLDAPYVTDFQMSGGPVVTGVNIGSNGIDANAKVVVTFDQAISQTQDIAKLASLVGGNATISRTANQIIFQLHDLPTCGAFSLSIAKGINSQYDIVSKNDWSFTSRINCRRATEVIGYSVNGRPIVAYYYGSGSSTVLFTGGIHGSEQSGKYILQSWVSHLDTNAYKIPAGRQVVVVPAVNPDGLASSARYNANNVNLDRNFAAANWKADIDTSSGIVVNGGGTSPVSEPETKALANLTASLQPRLEVSFHAQGRLVGANQFGDSIAIGNSYATSVGYTSMIGNAEETMGYSITGEYEDWVGERYGIPAILIELPTMTGNYFSAHQSVLWDMVNI